MVTRQETIKKFIEAAAPVLQQEGEETAVLTNFATALVALASLSEGNEVLPVEIDGQTVEAREAKLPEALEVISSSGAQVFAEFHLAAVQESPREFLGPARKLMQIADETGILSLITGKEIEPIGRIDDEGNFVIPTIIE